MKRFGMLLILLSVFVMGCEKKPAAPKTDTTTPAGATLETPATPDAGAGEVKTDAEKPAEK